jgi:hypothetical protein
VFKVGLSEMTQKNVHFFILSINRHGIAAAFNENTVSNLLIINVILPVFNEYKLLPKYPSITLMSASLIVFNGLYLKEAIKPKASDKLWCKVALSDKLFLADFK